MTTYTDHKENLIQSSNAITCLNHPLLKLNQSHVFFTMNEEDALRLFPD